MKYRFGVIAVALALIGYTSATPGHFTSKVGKAKNSLDIKDYPAGDFENASLIGRKGWIEAANGSSEFCAAGEKKDCFEQGRLASFTVSSSWVALLDTNIPTGQQMFVSKEGRLGYTLPHFPDLPPGSVTFGFLMNQNANGAHGSWNFWNNEWALCSRVKQIFEYSSHWDVYVQLPGFKSPGESKCYPVQMTAEDYNGPAPWEYET